MDYTEEHLCYTSALIIFSITYITTVSTVKGILELEKIVNNLLAYMCMSKKLIIRVHMHANEKSPVLLYILNTKWKNVQMYTHIGTVVGFKLNVCVIFIDIIKI